MKHTSRKSRSIRNRFFDTQEGMIIDCRFSIIDEESPKLEVRLQRL